MSVGTLLVRNCPWEQCLWEQYRGNNARGNISRENIARGNIARGNNARENIACGNNAPNDLLSFCCTYIRVHTHNSFIIEAALTLSDCQPPFIDFVIRKSI